MAYVNKTIPRGKHRIIEQSVISNGNFGSTAKLLVYAAINLPHCPPRPWWRLETMYPGGTGSPCAPRSLLCDPVDTERINGASNPCERILLERVRVGTRGRPTHRLSEFVMKFLEWGGNGNGDLISVAHDFRANNRPTTFNIPFKRYTFGEFMRGRVAALAISMDGSFETKYLSYLFSYLKIRKKKNAMQINHFSLNATKINEQRSWYLSW